MILDEFKINEFASKLLKSSKIQLLTAYQEILMLFVQLSQIEIAVKSFLEGAR